MNKLEVRGRHKESFLKIWNKSREKPIFENQTKFRWKKLNTLWQNTFKQHGV